MNSSVQINSRDIDSLGQKLDQFVETLAPSERLMLRAIIGLGGKALAESRSEPAVPPVSSLLNPWRNGRVSISEGPSDTERACVLKVTVEYPDGKKEVYYVVMPECPT